MSQDSTGVMILALAMCCMCSSSSGLGGFLFRKQLTKLVGGGGGAHVAAGVATGAAVGAAAVRSPKPSIAKGRSIGRKIKTKKRRPNMARLKRIMNPFRRSRRKARGSGPVRGVARARPKRRRRVGRKIGRGALKAAKLAWKYHPKNIVKRAALRAFNKSRIGKKFNRSKVGKKFNRGIKKAGRGIKKLFRRRCFSPETPVTLQNGESRTIKNIKLGDVLANGSVVKATMKILNETDPYYKLPGDILVTGSHYVKDGDTFKRVKDIEKAERTDTVEKTVYCLVTSDHKIPVGDYIFWDWEDDKIV
jgi:hypothetical protein